MRNEKGITLLNLVITIILIMILSSVGLYTGLKTYEDMKVEAFITKMKTVQEAVDKLCNKYTIAEINEMGISYNDISESDPAKSVLTQFTTEEGRENLGYEDGLKSWYSEAGDDNTINYRYFSTENISSILGIKDFDTPIFVNPRSRNVIAIIGVEYDDKMYYRQYDLSGGQDLPEPSTDTDFTLDASVKTFDNKAVIYVNTDKEVTEIKYYKKKEGTNIFGNPISTKNSKEITINESGIYKVEAKMKSSSTSQQDGFITKTADNINVTIVNKPMLVSGMTPVKYNENESEPIETTFDDKDWYNYGTKHWANVKLKDGSVYVWIPRYAYHINYTDSNNISAGGTIDIDFMKDTSSLVSTSGNTIKQGYKVMPAFQDGTNNGFANGEWDSELTGIWVAKYETTKNSDRPQNILVNNTCWTNNTPEKVFTLCRKMEGEYKDTYFDNSVQASSGRLLYGTYGNDNNNIDTHLIKNSEWGAVAYLSYSSFDTNKNSISRADSYYIKNGDGEGNSAKAYSSTGNYTGIYGLNGGAYDIVSGGTNVVGHYNYENKSSKYVTIYTSNIRSNLNNIYGDAMKETAGWDGCKTANIEQLIVRGGTQGSDNSGIFAYQNKNYTNSSTTTFRPVLIVEHFSNEEILGNASEIASNSDNIGKKVNYGKTYTNGTNTYADWEILYADDINVYIITRDYLAYSDLDSNGYNGASDFSDNKFTTIDANKYPAVADGWLYKIYSGGKLLYNGKDSEENVFINMKCAEYVLDSTNQKWSGLKNDYAKWVIGGPTMELIVASYNAVNTSNQKQIPDLSSSSKGYQRVLNDENDLPNTDTRPWNHGISYWLAAPSSDADNGVRRIVDYTPANEHYANIVQLRYDLGDDEYVGFRPVVCLKSDVILNWNSETNKYDLTLANQNN